jgi:PIN domain nuclease of toxin-antitoxin system
MNLLLDTHLVLWASSRLDLLPRGVAELLGDPSNTLHFSVVSIWEVAIKHALKRADFSNDPTRLRGELLANGYSELPITGPQAAAVARLPLIHRDPFDRLLLAQAIAEGITLLTVDPAIGRYDAPVWLV